MALVNNIRAKGRHLMRVTEGMETELGAGAGSLLTLADFLGADETGIKITRDGEHVRVKADSTSYPSTSVWLEPDDADGAAGLLRLRAAEVRAAQRGEPARPLVTFRQQLSPVLWLGVDASNCIVLELTTPEGTVLEVITLTNVDDVKAALDQARGFQLVNDQVVQMQYREGTTTP